MEVGVSPGNPAGRLNRRAQFEEVFNVALLTEGGPQESCQFAPGSRAAQATFGRCALWA